jgi:hypothetical protein
MHRLEPYFSDIRQATMFDIQNVADYFWQHSEEFWDLQTMTLAPVFDYFATRYTLPERVYSDDYGWTELPVESRGAECLTVFRVTETLPPARRRDELLLSDGSARTDAPGQAGGISENTGRNLARGYCLANTRGDSGLPRIFPAMRGVMSDDINRGKREGPVAHRLGVLQTGQVSQHSATIITHESELTIMQRDEKFRYIKLNSLASEQQNFVRQLVTDIGQADKVDEHGSPIKDEWRFGVGGSSKTWIATNWDLYAIGQDCHNHAPLAIVQVRETEKPFKRAAWLNIRKSYFLSGYNENGRAFAHSVNPQVIHYAINRNRDPILAVQNWIFQGDYTTMQRQGDIAAQPVKRAHHTALPIEQEYITIQDSHRLIAKRITQNGHVYALDGYLEHIPETHPPLELPGWWKLLVGRRAHAYSFARPTWD